TTSWYANSLFILSTNYYVTQYTNTYYFLHSNAYQPHLHSFPTRRSSDLKLFLILKSGVNHTSRGSISTSTLPSIKLRKCSSKIITSILSFISGRLATKSNQIKQLIRNGRSASLQRTFKKSFTSFSHST